MAVLSENYFSDNGMIAHGSYKTLDKNPDNYAHGPQLSTSDDLSNRILNLIVSKMSTFCWQTSLGFCLKDRQRSIIEAVFGNFQNPYSVHDSFNVTPDIKTGSYNSHSFLNQ